MLVVYKYYVPVTRPQRSRAVETASVQCSKIVPLTGISHVSAYTKYSDIGLRLSENFALILSESNVIGKCGM